MLVAFNGKWAAVCCRQVNVLSREYKMNRGKWVKFYASEFTLHNKHPTEKCTHEHNGVSWLFQFSSLSVWQRFAVYLSTVEVREVFGSGGLNAAWSVGTKIATWYTEVNILEYQQLWSEAIMLLWVHMCIATGIPQKHMKMDYIGLHACVEPLKTLLLST